MSYRYVLTFGLSLLVLSAAAQDDSPYAKFGYEGRVLRTPQERRHYMLLVPNADTAATVACIGFEPQKGRYYLFDKKQQVLASDTLSAIQMARFLSVDPLTKEYPWYTPYQFAGNTPIQAIDLDGLEEFIVTLTPASRMGGTVLNQPNDEFIAYRVSFSVLNLDGSSTQVPAKYPKGVARQPVAMYENSLYNSGKNKSNAMLPGHQYVGWWGKYHMKHLGIRMTTDETTGKPMGQGVTVHVGNSSDGIDGCRVPVLENGFTVVGDNSTPTGAPRRIAQSGPGDMLNDDNAYSNAYQNSIDAMQIIRATYNYARQEGLLGPDEILEGKGNSRTDRPVANPMPTLNDDRELIHFKVASPQPQNPVPTVTQPK